MDTNELARLEVWLEINKAYRTRLETDVGNIIAEASISIQRAEHQRRVCAKIEKQIREAKNGSL